ncbi:hypothetical protein [Helicobacter burdigaliensis]|uniref:hypothetical protein n=1 Tax=Helicobacter burdigaliensis TaxID=2315334 RepID=UPI000EF7568B|nr:hypothetical protein [Helicobacter burdigaliensis]
MIQTALVDFLLSLKNLSRFKRIKYDGEFYRGEIAQIQKILNNKDIDAMLDIWKKKLSQHYFELEHPLYPNIKTRAVYNIFNGRAANYVFMIDENNEYPWIFTQATSFIDYVIVPDFVINVASPWPCHGVDVFSDVSDNLLAYAEKQFGFTMAMMAPQHYTCFLFNFFMQMVKRGMIDESLIIDTEQCFFVPNECINNFRFTNKNNEQIVYLYPMGIPNLYRREGEEFIYKDSIKEIASYINQEDEHKQYDLIIWLGLSSARAWVEQEEGIVNIIKKLSDYFKRIKIYFNGLTAYDKKINNEAEQDYSIYSNSVISNNVLFENIKRGIEKNIYTDGFLCELVNLNMKDYREKICHCSIVDLCITEGNTTGLIPLQFCRKPGVNFIAPGTNGECFGTIVEREKIVSSHVEGLYHMSWEHIYNLLVKIIYNIKNIKLDYIEEVDAKLLYKRFCIEQKIKMQIPLNQVVLYEALEKIMQDNKKQDNAANSKPQSFVLGSAKERVRNWLAYKLGEIVIINSKSLIGIVSLPVLLLSAVVFHRQKQKIDFLKKIKQPSLEKYSDYQEAMKFKNHLSYKLGKLLIEANKSWYKGGYIIVLFKIYKLVKSKSKL